jgi:hypothetical protein
VTDGPPRGYGPFGERAFRGALLACAVLVVAGVALSALVAGAVGGVGRAFAALGALGLLVAGSGLLVERLLGRRP